jgi:hypothetical protein
MTHEALFELVREFHSNDWRSISMIFSKPATSTVNYRQLYHKVSQMMVTLYPDVHHTEAAHMVRNNLTCRPRCPVCNSEIAFRNDPKPYYPNFCTIKCRSASTNPSAEPIIVDGVKYKDFTVAMSKTGLDRETIRKNIFDSTIDTFKWDCDDHDAKCQDKLKSAHEILVDVDALTKWKESREPQTSFCDKLKIDAYHLRYALLYWGIESKFDQVTKDARDFLDSKERFCEEFSKHSMERLSVIYSVSTGTIKNYAKLYGLNTSQWANGVSMGENELFQFIKTLCPDAVQSYREFFGKNGKELDVWIPSKQIGIEFNGVYTHSDQSKAKDYHRTKHLQFRDAGIRYIQIWEDDWNYRNDKVKRFLTNALGASTLPRIGARKTRVVELSQSSFDAFLVNHHMQGTTKAKFRYGLMFDGDTVAVMGFKEIPSNVSVRYGDGVGVELIRFANTTVSGAFTKLLTHFERNNPHHHILSYADLEIVSPFSNVYSKNGFRVVKEIQQDYRYYNQKTKTREHKFNWRKEAFKQYGFDIDKHTEFQMADKIGLLRCYDSGKILYIKQVRDAGENLATDSITLDCF